MKKKFHFKKVTALLLTAVATVGILAGCGSTTKKSSSSKTAYRTVDEIKKDGTLKVGVFSDKAPFGYVDDQGKYQGYDVYFAERIAKDLGVKIEYTAVDPASRVDYVATGKVDLMLANFTVTDERAEKVDFALPYMKVSLGVVSPSSAPIKSEADLKGKTLILAKGTTAETYFTKNDTGANLEKYDQYADAYNALLDGRGDAFSTDNTEVIAWANQNKGFTVGITSLGDVDTIAPAVAKGNKTLLDWINKEITSLADEQFFHADYDATLKNFYGADINPDDLVVEGGKVE